MVNKRMPELLCVGRLESMTLNVSEIAFAGAPGVPLITPVLDKVNPAGRVPLIRDHLSGEVPPLAVSVAEYGIPTFPFGNGEPVVMVRLEGFGLGAACRAAFPCKRTLPTITGATQSF